MVLSGNPITPMKRHDQTTTIHGPIYFSIRKFSKIQEKLKKHNVGVGNERQYDPEKLLQELIKNAEDLVQLKSRIHRANSEKCELIYRLAELNSLAKVLQWIPTSTSWVNEGGVPVQRTAIIGEIKMDVIIEDICKKIETIQDELDGFNHQTIV